MNLQEGISLWFCVDFWSELDIVSSVSGKEFHQCEEALH